MSLSLGNPTPRGLLHAIGQLLLAPFRNVVRALAALGTAEGRKGWALIFMAGSAIALTGYAILALWYVRKSPGYVFWLGVLAHMSIIIVVSGFGGLLIKRQFKAKLGENREIGIDDISTVE